MFRPDINDPIFQAIIHEEEAKDKCPVCNAPLELKKEKVRIECTNVFCNYSEQINVRKR